MNTCTKGPVNWGDFHERFSDRTTKLTFLQVKKCVCLLFINQIQEGMSNNLRSANFCEMFPMCKSEKTSRS